MTESRDWDTVYVAGTPPPWDVGRPQPAFVRLADRGALRGHLLDAGCGTGENALLATAHSAGVVGVDVSPTAIARARAKASERGLSARFEVADALNLSQLGLTFDTVIDSGLFHVFDDENRARYVASLASALRSGGSCYLMCFSDLQPGTFGPRRVRKDEIISAFSDGWSVTGIEADEFVVNRELGIATARAWLATIRRL